MMAALGDQQGQGGAGGLGAEQGSVRRELLESPEVLLERKPKIVARVHSRV